MKHRVVAAWKPLQGGCCGLVWGLSDVKPSWLVLGCRGLLEAAQGAPGLRGGHWGAHECSPTVCSPSWLGEFKIWASAGLEGDVVGYLCWALNGFALEYLCLISKTSSLQGVEARLKRCLLFRNPPE